MTITTTFDPPLPSDSPAVFDSKAFALLGDLNNWSTEANALQTDVNAKQATASSAATTASTQAGLAATAKTDAEAAAIAALGAYDAFDDRYLGSKAANPTLDNDGNALLEGALYWNTVAKEMRAYNGTAWVTASAANAVSRTGDTMTGPLVQAAGTALLPSYTFSGSLSTGMWSPGAGIFAWSTGGAERMRIDASGNVLVTGSGGLGYGPGSGGTVTQATSKATGVTLNKPSGVITMNAATLNAGASVGFIVTNSSVTTSDAVSVTGLLSGADPGNYRIENIWVSTGSFAIRVTNTSAGNLSEALQISFNVHKGATS